MGTIFSHKKGEKPTAAQITQNDLFVNVADGIQYAKGRDNKIKVIGKAGTTQADTVDLSKIKITSGADGQSVFKSIVFARWDEAVEGYPITIPTGGTYNSPIPTSIDPEWSDGVPTGTAPIYMSTRVFTEDGKSPQQSVWTDPELSSAIGDGTKVQFSPNGITDELDPDYDWHDVAEIDDNYMRSCTSVDGGVTWVCDGVTLIKGESGAGAYTAFIYSDSSSTPTGGSYDGTDFTPPSGWENDPASVSADVKYMSTSQWVEDTPGVWSIVGTWSTPAQWNGVDGVSGVTGKIEQLDGAVVYIYNPNTGDWSNTDTTTKLDFTFTRNGVDVCRDSVTVSRSNDTDGTFSYFNSTHADGNLSAMGVSYTGAGTNTFNITGTYGGFSMSQAFSSFWEGEAGTDGTNGEDGVRAETVYLYRRTTTDTAPSKPSTDETYTFSTHTLTSVSGWEQEPQSSIYGEYLWLTIATASADASVDTDNILKEEWSDPAYLNKDGIDGYNAATLTLYSRYSSGVPHKPTTETTYTFSTASWDAPSNTYGWQKTIPATDGNPLYIINATAFSDTDTDTIAGSEWSDPVIGVKDGEDGSPGDVGDRGSAIVYIDGTTWPSNPESYFPDGVAIENDVLSVSGDATHAPITKRYNGSSWDAMALFVHGDALVTGTVYANKLDTVSIQTDIVQTSELNADKITAGALTSTDGTSTIIDLDAGTVTLADGGLTYDSSNGLVIEGKITGSYGYFNQSDDEGGGFFTNLFCETSADNIVGYFRSNITSDTTRDTVVIRSDHTNGLDVRVGLSGNSAASTALKVANYNGHTGSLALDVIGDSEMTGDLVVTGTITNFTGGHRFVMTDAPSIGDIMIITNMTSYSMSDVLGDGSVCNISQDKRVFGVFNGNTKGNLGYVNALGDGMINVCDANGDIENGDYICSSDVAGKGMRQHDDLLHNYTVAKALEDVVWDDESGTEKLIACTYHAA